MRWQEPNQKNLWQKIELWLGKNCPTMRCKANAQGEALNFDPRLLADPKKPRGIAARKRHRATLFGY
ncbi:hypothetical protein [Herpetosiphon geysericola]|uniref:Uncharacterized protein n=1 Tax=Herpetosiphon geysericola TaxID=70996 RepID=A0A0P6YKT6_9CHLR|nr:hypothetical protein [Herpetosiphon geysericola]KPL90429.1 hypothetical protein SE18_07440 [Herpetosiphon geysericola]